MKDKIRSHFGKGWHRESNEFKSSLFVSSVITAVGDAATRIKKVAEVGLKDSRLFR